MKTHIFYHSADLDGACSGAILHRRYPEAVLHPIDYGDPFPWGEIEPEDWVIMADFSLEPFEDMVRLAKSCHFVWIDHHKSAIDKFHGCQDMHLYDRVLDTHGAACELCWMWATGKVFPVNPAVKLLGRYDVWDHSDPDVLPFQYGMRMRDTRPENDELWGILLGDSMMEVSRGRLIDQIIADGKIVIGYQKEDSRKYMAANAFETTLDGWRLICVNRGGLNSIAFDSVYDQERHDAMCPFVWTGRHWKVSLYTDKIELDVSKIAASYGGGGHRNAAGFECDELPFELLGGKP